MASCSRVSQWGHVGRPAPGSRAVTIQLVASQLLRSKVPKHDNGAPGTGAGLRGQRALLTRKLSSLNKKGRWYGHPCVRIRASAASRDRSSEPVAGEPLTGGGEPEGLPDEALWVTAGLDGPTREKQQLWSSEVWRVPVPPEAGGGTCQLGDVPGTVLVPRDRHFGCSTPELQEAIMLHLFPRSADARLREEFLRSCSLLESIVYAKSLPILAQLRADSSSLSSAAEAANGIDMEADSSETEGPEAGRRLEASLVQLLLRAQFSPISAQDMALADVLKKDSISTLSFSIPPGAQLGPDQHGRGLTDSIMIFRRGFTVERETGLLLGAKLDYLQTVLLRSILFLVSAPLAAAYKRFISRTTETAEKVAEAAERMAEEGKTMVVEEVRRMAEAALQGDMDRTATGEDFMQGTATDGAAPKGIGRALDAVFSGPAASPGEPEGASVPLGGRNESEGKSSVGFWKDPASERGPGSLEDDAAPEPALALGELKETARPEKTMAQEESRPALSEEPQAASPALQWASSNASASENDEWRQPFQPYYCQVQQAQRQSESCKQAQAAQAAQGLGPSMKWWGSTVAHWAERLLNLTGSRGAILRGLLSIPDPGEATAKAGGSGANTGWGAADSRSGRVLYRMRMDDLWNVHRELDASVGGAAADESDSDTESEDNQEGVSQDENGSSEGRQERSSAFDSAVRQEASRVAAGRSGVAPMLRSEDAPRPSTVGEERSQASLANYGAREAPDAGGRAHEQESLDEAPRPELPAPLQEGALRSQEMVLQTRQQVQDAVGSWVHRVRRRMGLGSSLETAEPEGEGEMPATGDTPAVYQALGESVKALQGALCDLGARWNSAVAPLALAIRVIRTASSLEEPAVEQLVVISTQSVFQEPDPGPGRARNPNAAGLLGRLLGVPQGSGRHKADEEEGAREVSRKVSLRIYRSIALPDIKVVFPNKRIQFRPLDTGSPMDVCGLLGLALLRWTQVVCTLHVLLRAAPCAPYVSQLRLDLATLLGLLAYFVNNHFGEISSPSALLLDVISIVALLLFLGRASLGYLNTWNRYQLLVNKELSEKTVAAAFPAVLAVLDAYCQQQIMEAMLCLAVLMERRARKKEPPTFGEAKYACERFMLKYLRVSMDVPIADSLALLRALNLIRGTGADTLPKQNGSSPDLPTAPSSQKLHLQQQSRIILVQHPSEVLEMNLRRHVDHL